MQQTTKYKLDLIEKDDVFSPDALNENTQEVEKQLSRLDSADAALDARVTALEVHKMVIGSYRGGQGPVINNGRFIELGFTPVAVFVQAVTTSGELHCAVTGFRSNGIEITENGFLARSGSNCNFVGGSTYHYVAFT